MRIRSCRRSPTHFRRENRAVDRAVLSDARRSCVGLCQAHFWRGSKSRSWTLEKEVEKAHGGSRRNLLVPLFRIWLGAVAQVVGWSVARPVRRNVGLGVRCGRSRQEVDRGVADGRPEVGSQGLIRFFGRKLALKAQISARTGVFGAGGDDDHSGTAKQGV